LRTAAVALTLVCLLAGAAPAAAPQPPAASATATPIRHVIVVIGENRSFDHLFATYAPPAGETVRNLLSEGIVGPDGSPGPHFENAAQSAADVGGVFEMAPAHKALYAVLPPVLTGSAPQAASDDQGPPFQTMAAAALLDHGLLPIDLSLLLRGATGLPQNTLDTRLPGPTALPHGPFRLTPRIPYASFTADPAHRFFQMWQQMDCNGAYVTAANASGCLADLFPWVEVTVGGGSSGRPRPAGFTDRSTGEGSAAMGFYDMQAGDVPYLRELASSFALADNYHQAVIGGTGANHVMLGTGDMIWYADAAGHPAAPPADQIENPNPQPGTNNFYVQDGSRGGSYVNCADRSQPGVRPILAYLQSLPYHPASNCEPGRYYLVNNRLPAYLGDGTVDTSSAFVVPPSHLRTIGDVLLDRGVTFRYYLEGWDLYTQFPQDFRRSYCDTIADFLQYTPAIMTDAARRAEHIGDLDRFYTDLENGTLPAVAFVKPSGLNDGHPATSRVDIFEAFVRRLISEVRRRPGLWASTAILVTFDEGGGYYDSGYVQPLDFFGDGPRVPLIVVSPFSAGGRVVHTYTDHVSILKFIEKNWRLPPVTGRSRDNLPDPVASADDPYVPANSPAIGDLMDMFRFP
jgi:phospholipase C